MKTTIEAIKAPTNLQKKTSRLLTAVIPGLFALLFCSAFTAASMTGAENAGVKYITVVVVNNSGSPVSGVRVNYGVCSSLTCSGQGDGWRTGKDGRVVIASSTGCKICTFYIDGKAHKGQYSFGEKYVFKK